MKAKHPKAWAGQAADGTIDGYAINNEVFAESQCRHIGAKRIAVRIVPESDYRKMKKALRELGRELAFWRKSTELERRMHLETINAE